MNISRIKTAGCILRGLVVFSCTSLFAEYFLISKSYCGDSSIDIQSQENRAGIDYTVLDSNNEEYVLGRNLTYFEDRKDIIRFEEISSPGFEASWTESDKDAPSFGFSNSAFWLRFKVKNMSYEKTQWLFELAYPLHNDIEFYYRDKNGIYKMHKAGTHFEFSKRPINHMNFVFPISVGHEKIETFYIRSRGGNSMQFPMKIWSVKAFDEKKYVEYTILFVYYAVVFVMFLYNFFISVSIRNINYLYYILYIGSFGIFQSSINGLAFQYLWPNYPWWAQNCIPFFLGSAIFWIFLFSRNFLETRTIVPRLDRASYFFIGWSLIIMLLSFLVPYSIPIRMCTAITMLALPYLAIMGYFCVRNGFKPGIYYLVAFVAFFAGSVLQASRLLSFITSNFITLYGIQIGSIIEIVLLSLALGDKIRREQESARQKIKELNTGLEDKVREKTAELSHANERLQEIDKQKTAFFQNISHEIRSPLTLIMNPLEAELNESPENKNISTALKNSKRLFRIVNQLLDFQKYAVAKKRLDILPINLTELVISIGDYFRDTAERKNVAFLLKINSRSYDDGDHPGIFINGHVDALEKIVFNFLSNALKAIRSDKGEICLHLQNIENDAIISVIDNGIGITEENQKKLFQIFSQINEDTTKPYEGTGIGLALTRELAEQMNGCISVNSTYEKGSCFSVSFPLLKVVNPVFDLIVIISDFKLKVEIADVLKTKFANRNVSFKNDILEVYSLIGKYQILAILTEDSMLGLHGNKALKSLIDSQTNMKVFLIKYSNEYDFSLDIQKMGVKPIVFSDSINVASLANDIDQELKSHNVEEIN
ncbi:MAG: sensor histidine kinase, partial [Oligoflexales bacterium]|nr:sensor histidine kinase [Oligoflexales bacterium]